MTQEEIEQILKRYLDDQCTEEEKRFVETWIENMQSGSETSFTETNKDIIRNKVWAGIENQLMTDETGSTGFRLWKVWRVAAAIIVIAVSTLLLLRYFQPQMANSLSFGLVGEADKVFVAYTNTGKETVSVHLADGSTILVHPGSKIRYPKTFGREREVYLSGEAFFQVAKDPNHPFLVYSNEVTTRVLGTSFLIKAYDHQKEIVVAVSTGRVSVFSKLLPTQSSKEIQQEVILTPNQQVVYKRGDGKVEKKLVENPRILIPQTSMDLVYTNEPVTKLFKALEKLYGVAIHYDEQVLANCNITTEMTDDDGLFNRLDVICHVINAEYTIKNTEVVIKATGCNN